MPGTLRNFFLCLVAAVCFSCGSARRISTAKPLAPLTGSEFYRRAAALGWQQRDSLAVQAALQGNIPSFLKRLVPVAVSSRDSVNGRLIRATYFVMPDYLAIGTDKDWARVPLTPMAAQRIADSLGCFLPTRRMVDDIYKAAKVKLEPVPLYALRDSTPTMYHHHLIIEGQRKGKKGLIAGIKKDVVISGKVSRDSRPNRVAIYGWHKPDGRPIQPLYTGHGNWYVDYSHGLRPVWRRLKVEGRWMDYTEVLRHPVYRRLLCDEEACDFYRYPY
ncbi:MAG TPA: hypothetical protein VGE66_06870 [Chitinophagaceae bacterium]